MADKAWLATTLGQEVELLTGFPFKSEKYTDEANGISLLRGDNIVQGTLRWDGVKRWSITDTENISNYFLNSGDVVVAMDRPWIEAGLKYACISKQDLPCLLVQRVARLRAKEKLDQRFLRYVIASQEFTHHVLSVQTGTAVPHISGSQIKEFQFLRPPLPEQKAIAHILGTLDDKIELNREMNKTLEAMARAIFKSWFVDFDPVRAKMEGRQPVGMDAATAELFPDEFENEDFLLGDIPKGWKVSTLDKLSVIVDSLHQTPSYAEQGYPMVRVTDIKGGYLELSNCKRVTEIVFEEFTRKYTPQKGDIVFSRVGTYGISSYIGSNEKFCLGQNTVVINPKINSVYLYLYLQSNTILNQIEMSVVGSTQKTISLKNIKTLKILLPSESMLNRFKEVIEPIFSQINANVQQSCTLASIRDTLLPKLLSGEIRVKEAEKIVETQL
jgi:type I restriction enzyme S subunit